MPACLNGVGENEKENWRGIASGVKEEMGVGIKMGGNSLGGQGDKTGGLKMCKLWCGGSNITLLLVSKTSLKQISDAGKPYRQADSAKTHTIMNDEGEFGLNCECVDQQL